MIDTVILSIPKDRVAMVDMTAYGVLPWDIQARTKAYTKFIKNPSAQDSKTAYFPRITAYRRKGGDAQWESVLKIEFSAPKLVYQNNLDELVDADFKRVVELLRSRLKRMGVIISEKDLAFAQVTAVHYSKNVELQNGYTAQYVIGELGKVNINKRFDLTRARYMNEGQSICAYATTHSFIIYDKIADLNRGPKRAIDKDQTVKQLSLFEKLKEKKEVLRFEVRLSQKAKMNTLFKQLGFSDNPTFKDVFSETKSKAVLMNYWEKMIEANSLSLFAHSLTPKDLLRQILHAQKKMKGKTGVYLTGLVLLAREGGGLRELRAIFAKRSNERAWYRLVDDLKEVTEGMGKLRHREWYDQVKSALLSYKPIHIQGR